MTPMMDLWEVPEWGSDAPEAIAYPSLQAAGKVGRQSGKQSRRKEETVLERLIQGTVRLSKEVADAGAIRSPSFSPRGCSLMHPVHDVACIACSHHNTALSHSGPPERWATSCQRGCRQRQTADNKSRGTRAQPAGQQKEDNGRHRGRDAGHSGVSIACWRRAWVSGRTSNACRASKRSGFATDQKKAEEEGVTPADAQCSSG